MKLHISGDVAVPGDKSLSHRALMFAAVAAGESRLRGLLPGADCHNTASILRALGNSIPDLPGEGDEIRISSVGIENWQRPETVLDCGNSGTTARLLLGLLAGRPFESTLTGDESLRSRPMRRITDPLARMGAVVTEIAEPDRLPLRIRGGSLRGVDYRSPKASAQIKSAILLAGLSGGVDVSILEPVQSRDHTERILQSLGVGLREEQRPDGWFVAMQAPAEPLPPLEMNVPGDPSSAAFLIALAALADTGELRIRDVGVNPTRTGFFEALRRMGASIRMESERSSGGEPIADLIVAPGRLQAIEITAEEVPAMIDELPMLACIAARAEGETRITGAEELRAKETDRIMAVVSNLRSIGVEADDLPDGLVVRGSDAPLAGHVRAWHDHRIAMAFGVLAALPRNEITIDTPEVVNISYPKFWEAIAGLSKFAAVPT